MSEGREPLPTIAVIIPCWNAAATIERTLISVIGQHYPVEIIVVDDGSTDDGANVVRQFGSNVRLLSIANSGACVARNYGLAHCQADWIMFLDSDDYLDPATLMAWGAVLRRADPDLLIGPFTFEYGSRRVSGWPRAEPVDNRAMLREWALGKFTPPCSVIWRRKFLEEIGSWDPDLMRNQDGELMMRALIHNARISLSDKGLGIYVQHESGQRISRRISDKAVRAQIGIFQKLIALARARHQAADVLALASGIYVVAREAYSRGYDEIGHDALTVARAHGLKGHVGSFYHRTVATLLGLRNKTRLSLLIESGRQRSHARAGQD